MAYLDELASGRNGERAPGHRYEHVRVSDNARAHLGDTYHSDTYHVRLEDPLSRLPHAEDAPFNAYSKQHEPKCLPDTRIDLLKVIHSWADGQDQRCIFWLSGLAGTGKSTISRTVARSYYDEKRLAASFFFSRGGGDVSHAGKFVTSIAVQLAHNVPACREHICEAIASRPDIASQSLGDQWQHLVVRPLSLLVGLSSYVLVVDALDECDNDNNIRIIVQLLAEARTLTSVRLRVFLTSRPEVPIRHGFFQIADAEHQDYVLHNISPSVVDHDISVFLEYNFGLIAQECCQAVDWPGQGVIKQLCQSASGLFIWAATACRFIQQGGQLVVDDRLRAILGVGYPTEDSPTDGSSAEDSSTDDPPAALPEKRLNKIYLTVLQSPIRKYRKQEKKKWYSLIKEILGVIVLLLSPLSTSSLAKLLQIPVESVHRILYELHSIFNIPEDHSQPLRLHHPSFRDFLLNKDRCGDAFWVDEKQAHAALAGHCIQLMSSALKQDICGVDTPGMLVAEIERRKVEQSLPPELQYACLYWVQHVQKSGTQLRDNGQVHRFLQEHILHWLEALGWMGKVSEGVYAIASLESFVASSDGPSLLAFVHDAKRFVLYHRAAIEQAPLQTYSGLVFAPTASIVRKRFQGSIPRWIRGVPKVEEEWNALRQTLEGHGRYVTAVAFSPDGSTLASASDDKTVKLWEARTGALRQTLEGHKNWVTAVAFSPDGTTLASASGDKTVKLWEARTGALRQTLVGHGDWVRAVAFSPDGTTLASASGDKTVKLWEARTGALRQTLEGHGDYVRAVAFSPDSTTLASVSDDKTVKLWEARTGALRQTLEGHGDYVRAVVFSPDSTTLASASADKTVKLWEARTGALRQTLEGHGDYITAVAFSPDGTTLASASADKTVKLWEARTGALRQTLEGHENWVRAVAFSPDGTTLASASADKTVKLWEAKTGALRQTLEGHGDYVAAVAFSPDGTTLASASDDKTVKLWEAKTGALLQTLDIHAAVYTLSFSEDGTLLQTNRGSLPIPAELLPTDTPTNRLPLSPSVFVEDQWVHRHTKRILWLPPDYRPYCIAVHGAIVGFGYKFGRIILMEFAF